MMVIRCTFSTLSNLAAALTLSAAALTLAHAADFTAGPLEMNDLWVRGSVPGQTNGAGYMQINNPSGASDRLLSAQSEASTRLELHTVQDAPSTGHRYPSQRFCQACARRLSYDVLAVDWAFQTGRLDTRRLKV